MGFIKFIKNLIFPNSIDNMILSNRGWLLKRNKENPWISDEEKKKRAEFVMGKASDLIEDYEREVNNE